MVGQLHRARGIHPAPPVLRPRDALAAADLYRSGRSLARVAEKFDTTATTVQRRLMEIGVRMRDAQGRGR